MSNTTDETHPPHTPVDDGRPTHTPDEARPPHMPETQNEECAASNDSSAGAYRVEGAQTPSSAVRVVGAMDPPVMMTPTAGATDSTPVNLAVTGEGDYPVDTDVLAEIIERRNMDQLQARFGGVQGYANLVKSSIEGITTASVEGRRSELGINELNHKEPVTFLEMLADAFGDRVIQILTVAAIISIIFGLFLPDPYTGEVERSTGWIKGVAIIISVFVVTFTGAIQNYNKAKKFEEMEREQAVKPCSVHRDGKEVTVESTDLVVGDVLVLETGMEMTCDGLLLKGEDLRTNESPITGEPDLIEKSMEKDVFIVSGTSVEEGTGTVIIAAVGMKSFRGKLKEALEVEDDGTPLQQHLEKLGDDIGIVGMIVSVAVMLALCLKEAILIWTDQQDANAAKFLGFVIIAITLIAVAIPEGLPLAVQISLAFSMKAMMQENCLVRVLASCETMGAATAVCSDKTGTLTTNEMTVVQAMIAEDEFVLDGYGVMPRNPGVSIIQRDSVVSSIKTSPSVIDEHVAFPLAVNSTARQQTDEDGILKWVGNKTEAGILGLLVRLGRDFNQPRKDMHQAHDYKQFPFSSIKKRMTTVMRRGSDGYVAYIKGASENILEQCDRYLDRNGKEQPLGKDRREEYTGIITNMAMQGNRTIGFAYNRTDFTSVPEDEPEEMQFVFVGVLGIQDPIRQEVPDAIAKCESAHLIVRMVTGDNINTAIAISKKCGLYKEERGDLAMTGPDFRDMYRNKREELCDLLPRLRVLARSSPNDKFVLVGLLQDEHGEVIGVTGDGTNDAPALKLADVGLAMQSGTDIAKGAADMVLTDDNFATVVTAIKWGRSVNDNIKKFLQYQLAINAAGVGLTVVGSLASERSKEPIAPVQLLWLNLIMDTLAALSLATELPEERCLTRLPVYKQAPLITNKMRLFIGVHGTFQFIIVMLILFLGHNWFDTIDERDRCAPSAIPFNDTARVAYCKDTCEETGGSYKSDTGRCLQGRTHSTILFNAFIWFQIFNVVNARKIYGEINAFEGMIDRSRIMLVVFLIVIGLQVIAVELGGDALSTTGLSGRDWGICIAFGASEWIVGLIVRLLPVENYIPTKEEIIAAHREEKARQEEEEREKAEKEEQEGQE